MFNEKLQILNVDKPLSVANDTHQLNKIQAFRAREYKCLYPEVTNFHNDVYDEHACVLFTRDHHGEVNSTGRLAFDGPHGLPDDSLFESLIRHRRESGAKIAELGRLIISDSAGGLLRNYYKAFYEIAIQQKIDSIIIVMRKKDIPFHSRMFGVFPLSLDLGVTFGSQHIYTCMEWRLSSTTQTFFEWSGIESNSQFSGGAGKKEISNG